MTVFGNRIYPQSCALLCMQLKLCLDSGSDMLFFDLHDRHEGDTRASKYVHLVTSPGPVPQSRSYQH